MRKTLSSQKWIASLGGILMAGALVIWIVGAGGPPQQALEDRLKNLPEQVASPLSLVIEVSEAVIKTGEALLKDGSDTEKSLLQDLKNAHSALLQALISSDKGNPTLSPVEEEALARLKKTLSNYIPEVTLDERKPDTP